MDFEDYLSEKYPPREPPKHRESQAIKNLRSARRELRIMRARFVNHLLQEGCKQDYIAHIAGCSQAEVSRIKRRDLQL